MGGRDRRIQWLHRCVKHLTSLNKVEGEEGVTRKAALWPLEGTMACTHRCSLSHTTWTEISVLNGKDPWPSRLVLPHSPLFLALLDSSRWSSEGNSLYSSTLNTRTAPDSGLCPFASSLGHFRWRGFIYPLSCDDCRIITEFSGKLKLWQPLKPRLCHTPPTHQLRDNNGGQ